MSPDGRSELDREGSDGPLATLEALRRDSVAALSQRLAEARAELSQRAALVRELQGECLRCEQSLAQGRLQFGAACSVRELQSVEGRLRGLELELGQIRARLGRAACAEREARADVDAQADALLAAERARRAASGLLESQRTQTLKLAARVEEEEAEEAFRARREPPKT